MKIRNWICLFVALLLFVPLALLQMNINYRRMAEGMDSRIMLMPGQVAGSLVLSGFRGLAADLLWLNVEEYWHKGQHYRMLPLMETVAFLQPQYITPWAIGGWHMSYNIFSNIGRERNSFIEVLEEVEMSVSESERDVLMPVFEIAKEAEEMINFRYGGLAEDELPGLQAKLEGYFLTLSKIQRERGQHPAIDAAAGLVSILFEQVDWYDRGIQWLRRGVAYNRERYDLYFELGWIYYHKGLDYPNAVRFLERAIRFPHPEAIGNVVAHAYENNGQVEEALKQWEKQLDTGFKEVAERAIKAIKEEGAFNPHRRRALGLDSHLYDDI